MGGARHGKGKGVFLVLALFALLFFLPSRAYAADNVQWRYDGVVYGPEWVSPNNYPVDVNAQQWVIVNAPDKFSAAVYACGGNPFDLTSDQKAYLSNDSTGGDFYRFSLHFMNIGGSFALPDWFVSPPMAKFRQNVYDNYANVYGDDDLFIAAFTPAEKNGAFAYFDSIKDGDIPGSGGGNEQIAAHYTLDSADFYGTPSITQISGSWSAGRPRNEKDLTINVNISTTVMNSANNYLQTHPYICVWSRFPGTMGYLYGGRSYNNYACFSLSSSTWYIDASNNLCTDGDVYTWNDTASTSLSISVTVTINSSASHTAASPGQTFGRSGRGFAEFERDTTPPVPETNWPDDGNVVPTPPDLPEPQNPVTDPQPDPPTPQPSPTFPIYVDVSTTNYTADLQGILDALNDHCIHLQNALHTQFSDFWTVLSTKMTNDFSTLRQFLHGQFGWLGETIQDEMSETRDYLKELFEWLADQFDFTISGGGYNDSTVVSWLKKIYSKLGSGNVSTRPVDPVADPDQTGSWLDILINNLLTALEDLFPGLIGQVADFFGGTLGNLTQKFPFSIPWDVAAILGMLVAEPVAPSVEIPAYTLTNEGLAQVGTYDIDLSDYDAAWGAVRIMMRIAFALYVCVHTKDFLEVLERVMM